MFIVKWKRADMKTIITIRKDKANQWKVETHSAIEGPGTHDMYL